MRRYNYLTQRDIYEALNEVRNALLSAKDGNEVDEILYGLFTDEERLQLGRRIIIAKLISQGVSQTEIVEDLHVGVTTISSVYKKTLSNPKCFQLIFNRKLKVEKEYQKKQYRLEGASILIRKKRVYTGIRRKDFKR